MWLRQGEGGVNGGCAGDRQGNASAGGRQAGSVSAGAGAGAGEGQGVYSSGVNVRGVTSAA